MDEPMRFVIPYCLFPDPPESITAGRMLLLGVVQDPDGIRLLTDVRNIYGRPICSNRCRTPDSLGGRIELVSFAPPDLKAHSKNPWRWVLDSEDEEEVGSHARLPIQFLPCVDLYSQCTPPLQEAFQAVYGYVSKRDWL